MNRLNEEFQVHDTLNPKLWDTTSKKLLPKVRKKLVEIVDEFEKYGSIPIVICDVQLVGSNASYNYTENSDLDVHIIANFESIPVPIEVLEKIYNTKKSEFNKTYDIKLYGIDVEMYVQNINSTTVSNGIYSLCDDEWVKEPKPMNTASKKNTEKEVGKWKEKIGLILQNPTYENVSEAINILYLIRHNSIAAEGEHSKGNQIFKDIRNLGLFDRVKEELNNQISKQLSLESLAEDFTKGQIINSDKLD